MKYPAQIHSFNDFSGTAYVEKNSLFELTTKPFQLIGYRHHYNDVIYTLRSRHVEDVVINNLVKCYIEILLDESFQQRTEYYCHLHDSVINGLMAFYETDILPVLAPSISIEILSIIKLLSSDNILSEPLPKNPTSEPILISEEISVIEWLNINVSSLVGVVLINSSIASHSFQIIKSLQIPFALITIENLDLSSLEGNSVFCSLKNNTITLEP
jgi:hypothetical protein